MTYNGPVAKNLARKLEAAELLPVVQGTEDEDTMRLRLGLVYLACGVSHVAIAGILNLAVRTIDRWAIRHAEEITNIQTLREAYFNNTIDSTIGILLTKGFVHSLLMDTATPDFPVQFRNLAQGIETLRRVVSGELGAPDGPGVYRPRTIKAAVKELKILQTTLDNTAKTDPKMPHNTAKTAQERQNGENNNNVSTPDTPTESRNSPNDNEL